MAGKGCEGKNDCATYWEHLPVSCYKPKLDISVSKMHKLYVGVVSQSKVKLSHGKFSQVEHSLSHMKLIGMPQICLFYDGFLEFNISFIEYRVQQVKMGEELILEKKFIMHIAFFHSG